MLCALFVIMLFNGIMYSFIGFHFSYCNVFSLLKWTLIDIVVDMLMLWVIVCVIVMVFMCDHVFYTAVISGVILTVFLLLDIPLQCFLPIRPIT